MSGFTPAIDPVLGKYYTYTATNTSLQRFVVLPNGTDICYMVKKSSQDWETVWYQPSNECEYYGTCGPNAKCTALQDGKAKCACLKGLYSTLRKIISFVQCTKYGLQTKDLLQFQALKVWEIRTPF